MPKIHTSKPSARTNRRFAVERLEPRWLLSANPLAVALAQALAPLEPEQPIHDWTLHSVDTGQAAADVAQVPAPASTFGGPSVLDLTSPLSASAQALAWQVPAGVVAGAASHGVSLNLSTTEPPVSAASAQLSRLMGQAMDVVRQQLGTLSAEQLLTLFPGGSDAAASQDAGQASLLARVEAVRQQWLGQQVDVDALLVDGGAMGETMAGFTAHGPLGKAAVFVNAQWLASLGDSLAGGDSAALRVLVEELGHSIDAAIHGDSDSPGDEGENFAALALTLPLDASQSRRIALEDDRGSLVWGLSTYVVEQATISSNQNIASGQILDADLEIAGDVTLTSTYVSADSGNGRLLLGIDRFSTLDGNSDVTADRLTLQAGGVVRVYGAVGGIDPLEGLTVRGVGADLPNTVIFDEDVTVAGDLVIDTEGIVTFSGRLTITGGNLIIRGATLIEFKDVVQVNGGNLLLEGNEINLLDSGALFSTGGVLEMRTTTLGLGIEVADPNQQDLSVLNLSQNELERIAEGGFSRIVLGHYTGSGADARAVAGQGAVRIAGIQSANQFTFHAPLEVYGGSIRIEDINIPAQPPLAVNGSIKLDATGNIEIRNRLLATTSLSQASALQDITLYSSTGYVAQFNETRSSFGDSLSLEPIQGRNLVVRAQTGIDLIATEVVQAELVNHGATGGIRLTETAAGDAVNLVRVEQANADATGDVWLQSTGDMTVGSVVAVNADVAVITGGSVIDGDAAVDVSARGLYLQTGTAGAIGSGTDALETTVQSLAMSVGSGGAFIRETNAVNVETVSVAVSLTSQIVPSQSNAVTGSFEDLTSAQNGSLVLVAAGAITLADGLDADGQAISANGSGNVLVQTLGTDGSITVNADVQSTSGNISVLAAASVALNANADIRTSSTGAASGSIDLQALSGSITQETSSVLFSSGAQATARLLAAQNITVGDIELADGQVSLTATAGSVLDADDGNTSNDSDTDISAAALRLSAGADVGGSVNHLETAVGTLSAASVNSGTNGGIYILEANDLIVGSVGLSVNRVGADASTTTASSTDASQSDISTSGGNGAIVLRSTAGSITLTDGLDADGQAISAHGSGNVLVQTLGAGSNITLNANADVQSTSGNISVLAAASVALNANADIRTSSTGAASGSIDLQALSGSITQAASSVLFSSGAQATARLLAAQNITVGDIELADGQVSLTATAGSVLDADDGNTSNDSDTDISAAALRLSAGADVGGSVNHLETAVGTLSAASVNSGTNGGIYILEANDLIVGSVGLSVNRVGSDASTTTASSTDASQSDISTSGGNGAIVLRSTAGSITLTDGLDADGQAISAHGSGNVLVQTLGAGSNITLNANADVQSTSGNISVLAAGSVSLAAGADIRTSSTGSSSGSIDLQALSGSITQETSSVLFSSGAQATARLLAAQNITVGDIELAQGQVSLTATAGSVLDADDGTTSNDSDTDISASALRLSAGADVGGSVNHLETTVGTLSAASANSGTNGGIYILEANDLIVGSVGLSVNRVGADASTTTASSTDTVQSDISTSGGNGAIVLRSTAGSITLTDGLDADGQAISAHGSGNVLVQTLGAGGNITLNANADVQSTSGNISVLAAGSVSLAAGADIRTSSTGSSSGSIDLQALSGSITQETSSVLFSSGAQATARLLAAQNITVGDIELADGQVSLTATAGSVLDADDGTTSNDSDTDISASALRLSAGADVGGSVNHLETTVVTLSAASVNSGTNSGTNGGIYILEANDLIVGSVGLSVNRVGSDASTTTASSTDTVQSDISTSGGNGAIVLRSTAGSITLTDGLDADGQAISAHGSGNVLVQTLGAGSNITLNANADVQSTSGNISVLAAGSVSLAAGADIRTSSTGSSSGSIDLQALSGSITQETSSVLFSSGAQATARLLAAQNITVGDIELADGQVSLTATAGSVLDADDGTTSNDSDTDISASALRLSAGADVGGSVNHLETTVVTLSAASVNSGTNSGTNGGIYILEANDLIVGSVGLSVNRVGSDASTTTASSTDTVQSDISTSGGNGAIVLRSTAGSITLTDGLDADGQAISAHGSGNVLVQTLGAGSNITLNANADVQSTSGNISVLAAGSVSLAAGADIRTSSTGSSSGSIDLQALSGSITQETSSVLFSSGAQATARLLAAQNITVGDIELAQGQVSLTATAGSVLDADDGNTSNDSDTDISAAALRLSAGADVGGNVNHLETTVGTLSAASANSGTNGGIYILEANDLIVGSVGLSVNRVGSDASTTTASSTDTVQSDISTSGGNGAIVLRSTAGSITLTDGLDADGQAISAHGSGNVLVQTLGAGSNITLNANADVQSTSGNISVLAAGSVSLAAGADIRTSSTGSSSGSIDLQALSGSITQETSSVLFSSGAQATARLLAAQNITVGDIELAQGQVSLTATAGSVLDADDGNTSNDSDTDISAAALRLSAGADVGGNVNHLETTVGTLSAASANSGTNGGIYILEANDLIVGSVGLSVNRVGADASTTTASSTDAVQSDLSTSGGNGAIVLRSTAGSITLTDGLDADGQAISAHGSGNVLVQAIGAGSDITLNANADVQSTSGNISVLAAGSVSLNANADIRTSSTGSSSGSIDLQALSGSITQETTSTLFSSGAQAAARLLAAQNITVGDIELADGQVSLTATAGSVLDADDGTTSNDSDTDISASALRLSAGADVGGSVNHLETTVGTLSAASANSGTNGGIYILEANDLIVGSVGLSVNRVGADASTTTASSTDTVQSDISTSGGNGAIVLRSTAGSITLTDGLDADGQAISAHGSGNVLVQAIGAGSDITLNANADVQSTSGNISVLAAGSVSLNANADIRTSSTGSSSGSIDLQALSGSITQETTSTLFSSGAQATARLLAAQNITVGDIELADGQVSLTATAGSVLDADALIGGANDADADISAAALRLSAGTAVGTNLNHLETAVGTLSAASANGGIFVLEANDLIVGSVGLSVNRVGSDASTTTASSTDTVQSDISTSGGNGAIVLRSTAGSITLTDGLDADGQAISAHGSGNVLVQALGAGSNITLNANADVQSASGNISVLAAASLTLNANADVRTSSSGAASGSIDLQAGSGSITQSATSTLFSSGAQATARLLAAQNITVGDIELAQGQVSLTATAGSVLDADTLVGGANDADADISAAALRLSAGADVGGSVNHLETTVVTLSAASVNSGTNGGIYILEANDLIVGSVGLSVNRVGADASTTTASSTDAVQSDISTSGGNGAIVLRSTAGSITLTDGLDADGQAISAHGSGNVLVQAIGAGGNITLNANADVQSTSGNISVLAAGSVALSAGADIRTSSSGAASGSIDLQALSGSITQSATSTLFSSGAQATARLLAAQNITVGDIELADGQVSLTATAGSVLDADALVAGTNDSDADISASALRLSAGTAVGTRTNHLETTVGTLSAASANGGIFVLEADALIVGSVGLSVNRVGSDASTTTASSTDASQSDLSTSGGNGAIVLRSTAGSITLTDGLDADGQAISANGSGNVLVQALGAGSNITLNANADVQSTSGNISVLAAGSVSLAAEADIRTSSTGAGSGSIDLQALSGSITQAASSTLFSSGAQATARLLAAQNITVGDIELAQGQVSLTATAGSVLDADDGNTSNDSDTDISAAALRLSAGADVGGSVNHLETAVVTLSAASVNSGTNGGIYILEANDLIVGSVGLSVNRVGSDASTTTASSTDTVQSDISTSGGNGAIVLRSTAGSITLTDGLDADGQAISAHGSGNVLVQAIGAGGNITLNANADVQSTSGNISVLAAGSVSLAAGADIRTSSTGSSSGSIDLQALSGSITQAASSVLFSSGAQATARLLAAENITVGGIDLADGQVSLTATAGSVLDADALVAGTNDSDADISASALRLSAGTAVGTRTNHLETTVGTLSAASANGGIFVLEANDLIVGSVGLSVNRVGADASTTTASSTDASQSDLSTSGGNGAIVLRSTAGSITLTDGLDADGQAISAHGSGNVLVQALGAGSNITLNANADVQSASGNISVLAAASLTLNANADVRTSSSGAASGSIDLQAGSGSITQSATSTLFSSGAQATARLLAAQNITVGDIELAQGQVSLTATAGSVLDADTLVGGANDADADISAAALRLSAGADVGGSVNHLETTVGTLSAASANGGIFVLEADDLIVGSVGLSVNRVGADASTTTASSTDTVQSDLSTSGGNGAIVLRSTAGSITLTDGLDADGQAISAHGSGNVLVQALGAGSNITLNANADVQSASGNISVLAAASLTLNANADVRTTSSGAASGSIDLQAGSGSITQSASSVLFSSGAQATARLLAAQNITVGDIELAQGQVSLTATAGSVLDADTLVGGANDADADISAAALRLSAGTAVGTNLNHLETTVGTLSAASVNSGTNGGIYILEANDLIVGSVGLSVNRVGADASTTTASSTDAVQSDISTSGGNGAIVLRSTAGSITLTDGLDADGQAISAHGSGNVLVQAIGAGGNITLNANADVQSTSGNISVLAAGSVALSAGADIRTSSSGAASGSIDLQALSGSITQSATSTLFSSGAQATARLLAAQNITVGDIELADGQVSLTATAGSVLDADDGTTSNDSDTDISASALRLSAGADVGGSVNHLETTVGTLSAASANSGTNGGIYILEANDLIVGSVGLSVNRVGADASTTTASSTDTSQSDISTSGGNGAIVLRSTAGSITLTDGLDADGQAISAHGSGNVLVQTLGAGSNITLNANADVQSTSGNISVLAAGSVSLAAGADIRTSSSGAASGSIDLQAGSGSITQAASSVLFSSGAQATARLLAAQNITVGDIELADGQVSLSATAGSVLDADALVAGANDSDADISAASLYLRAGMSIALSSNALETTVTNLALIAEAGDAHVVERNGLVLDTVSLSVHQVDASGQSVAQNAAGGQDLTVGGTLSLRVLAGDLLVASSDRLVSADDLLLEVNAGRTGTSASALRVDADTLAGRFAQDAFLTSTGAINIGSVLGVAGVQANAHWVLTVGALNGGALQVSQAVNSTGNLRMDAAGSVALVANVSSGASLSLLSQGAVTSAAGSMLSAVDDVYLRSSLGAVDLAGSVRSQEGNLLVQAGTSVSVHQLQALNGHVAVVAEAGDVNGKAALVDIQADALSVSATGGVGALDAPLNISVFDAAFQSGAGGVYVAHTDLQPGAGLTISRFENVAFSVVQANGALQTLQRSQAGVTTSGGGDLNVSAASDLVVSTAINATGEVLLDADLVSVGALVQSSGDRVSVRAQSLLDVTSAGRVESGSEAGVLLQADAGGLNVRSGAVVQAGSGGLSAIASMTMALVGSLNSAGTVDVVAGTSLSMETGTGGNRVEGSITAAGDVRVQTGTTLGLGVVTAANRSVALLAGTSVVDGDVNPDVIASALYLQTGTAGGVGSVGDALDVSVDRLALRAGSAGACVRESDGVAIDTVAVSVVRQALNGAGSTLTAGGADLVVTHGLLSLEVRQGSIQGNGPGSDVTAQELVLTTSSTGGVGRPDDSLQVSLTGALSGVVGSEGVYLQQSGVLRVADLSAGGTTNLQASDNLLLGRLNAVGQTVIFGSGGAVLMDTSAPANADATRLVAREWTVVADEGVGAANTPVLVDVETFDIQAGTAGLFLQDLNNVRVLRASGDGPLEVNAPLGAFIASTPQSFDSPLTVRSADVTVSEPLEGARIDLQSPPVAQGQTPRPIVVGATVPGVTPGVGVFLSTAEVANLMFDDIVIGSSQVGQQIWVQSAPSNPNDQLVFNGRLTLNASQGETRFSGWIEGEGLTLNGSGRTSYFQGVDMLHSGNVTISDTLDVSAHSILELADTDPATRLVLTINGNIVVRAGQTLQLLADDIVFGRAPGGAAVSVVLEAGATLVLGSQTITVGQDVTFDSNGGHVVLRGAPSATPIVGAGAMQIDHTPSDLQLTAVVLDSLAQWIAADRDGDAGLRSLTLGDASAATVVTSPSIWNALPDVSVQLRGTSVQLGAPGGAAWTLNDGAVLRATSGDLRIQVDLAAQGDVSLVANSGAIRMDAGTTIDSRGTVALSAASGIDVGQIEADQRIELFSTAGTVRAVAALPGQAHLVAPAVSFYGYGLSMPLASGAAVLVVDAGTLQVAGPTGTASRGYSADGSLYYRLMDQGTSYHQLQVFDEAPDRVMVPRTDLQQQAAQVAQSLPLGIVGNSVSASAGRAQIASAGVDNSSATARYLAASTPITVSKQTFGVRSAPWGGDDIQSMEYGLSDDGELGATLLDSSNDLLRSTGQLLAASSWAIESEGW